MTKQELQQQAKAARLPLDPRMAEKYALTMSSWDVLCRTIFPSAKSAESIRMALEYCKARNLDVFKRPVHIVPMWSSVENALVETVWPGISELRTTAFRTGQFGGVDPTEFGPTITKMFSGEETYWENKTKKSRKIEVEVSFPEWARINIYRVVNGERHLWVGPTVYWLETYAKAGRHSDAPNAMWQQRPFGQLEKCAEAASLRRSFPEEFSSEYVAEEMEGGVWAGRGVIIEHEDSAPPVRKGETKTPTPYDVGKAARHDGFDTDAAPDGMSTAEYREWIRGWKEADAELTKASDDAKPEEPAGEADESQQGLDLEGGPGLTDYELELKDGLDAALDMADIDQVEKAYLNAPSGKIANPEVVEDWIQKKRDLLKRVK